MFKQAVDSIMLGPHPYLLREQDNLRFLSNICEKRLYSITEFYLLLADSSYEVPRQEIPVSMNEVLLSYERCLSRFTDPGQQKILKGLHSRWAQWYSHRADMQHTLSGNMIDKYGLHLENLLYSQFDFYEKMFESGFVYNPKNGTRDLSDRRKYWL